MNPVDERPVDGPEASRLVVLAVLFEAGLAPLALVLGRILNQPPLAGFAWSMWDACLGAVATLPMLALLAIVVRWPVGPLGPIKQFFDREVRPLLRTRPWYDLALISIAAGVGEEMLFRGVIQGALSHALGQTAGLVVASLIFGALHPITRAYTVLAAALGAYLGGTWLFTGNLLSAMVTHGLYDFVALIVLLRDAPPKGS
ncbi:MAG: CPBP family intramembrane metalloprotease [Isosphaeraceae bacterium]|nr:CPBP family intramembrane metalloprotease [Isosphaeraceae bacterium]